MSVVNLTMSPLRKRNTFIIFIGIIFVPFCFFVIFSVPDKTSEEALVQRIAELQIRIQYLDSIFRSRQEDYQKINENFGQMYSLDNTSQTVDMKHFTKNLSVTHASSSVNPGVLVKFPTTYQFLPHLLDDPNSLKLSFLMSKNRVGVSLVFGIPTVRREKYSYIMDTLQSLLNGLNEDEIDDVVIVIFIAETDLQYVVKVANEIEKTFSPQLESGLIEIIAPSPGYYPDFDKLPLTLGDSRDRVKWRSKQNLDYAFLMSYCQIKGTFYVQLEDDILAKPSYATRIKQVALEKTSKGIPWIVLDFCQLGFIGKLFKNADLPWLIQFFQMFFNDKPVDWLLDCLISTKICNWEKVETCKAEKSKVWIHYKPSLFQHIGTHSSLKGKVQKLKDKQFGKMPLFVAHENPPAKVSSAIKHYKQFSLERAYLGETFFWGLLPQPGDQLLFKFKSPIIIQKFLFKSGNAEHPTDKFYNTTVEVKPVELVNQNAYAANLTQDGFVVIGKFESTGIASGIVDEALGKIHILRLNVHSESDNWAILSEIHIQQSTKKR